MADVQKSAFSLSSATIMVAPAFGTIDCFSLTPAAHSVGMAEEVKVTVDSSINSLLNGVAQAIVDSKRTGVKPSITGNIYEYTAANFMRSQAMNGSPVVMKRAALTTAAAGGAVSLTMSANGIPGDATTAPTEITDIPSGSTLLLQHASSGGSTDADTNFVFPTRSSGAATLTTGVFTVPIAGIYQIPVGMSFAVGDNVWIVQEVGVGDISKDDLFSVKIAGVLTNFDRPVVAVFPKVRMVKGFDLTFSSTQYSSMAWEMQPLLLSSVEAAAGTRLADIGTKRPGVVYVGG